MPVSQPLRERIIAPQPLYTKPSPAIREVARSPLDPDAPRELIPYLALCSQRSTSASTNPSIPPGDWTHVVRLLPAARALPVGHAHLIPASRRVDARPQPHILEIRVPAELFFAKPARSSRLADSLPVHTLRIVRDFLALALPYYASAHPLPTPGAIHPPCGGWPVEDGFVNIPLATPSTASTFASSVSSIALPPRADSPQADPVRVLLLGPARLTLHIALVYLTYASGRPIRAALRGILEEGPEWAARVVGDDEMGMSDGDLAALEDAAMNAF